MNPIALDPGFGNTKAAVITLDGYDIAIMPSVVGVGHTDLGLLSLGDLRSHRRRRRPNVVAFDGITYLVGHNVAQYARPIQRMDFHRLADGPELRALLYATFYRLLGPGLHRGLALMIGLPVEILADRARARSTLHTLKSWLVGDHVFIVDDQKVSLEIVDAKAMAQPAGTFFAWGMDDRGHWSLPGDYLKAPVGVCDIGFNTLDLFAVQSGEVIARYTGGDAIGIRRAAEVIVETARDEHGVELSLREADDLLRESQPVLYTAAGEIDLAPLVVQALNVAAGGVLTLLDRLWGPTGGQFQHLLFTGGGAKSLERALKGYPHGVIFSIETNALGLARYARRAVKS